MGYIWIFNRRTEQKLSTRHWFFVGRFTDRFLHHTSITLLLYGFPLLRVTTWSKLCNPTPRKQVNDTHNTHIGNQTKMMHLKWGYGVFKITSMFIHLNINFQELKAATMHSLSLLGQHALLCWSSQSRTEDVTEYPPSRMASSWSDRSCTSNLGQHGVYGTISRNIGTTNKTIRQGTIAERSLHSGSIWIACRGSRPVCYLMAVQPDFTSHIPPDHNPILFEANPIIFHKPCGLKITVSYFDASDVQLPRISLQKHFSHIWICT